MIRFIPYALPFILPILMVLLARVVAFVAGLEWTPEVARASSDLAMKLGLFLGISAGIIIAASKEWKE